MKDKYYNFLKYIVQIVIPASVVFITGLGEIYKFEVANIVNTLLLTATFGGSLLGISSLSYQAGKKNDSNTSNDKRVITVVKENKSHG